MKTSTPNDTSLPKPVRDALEQVLAYLGPDEATHYKSLPEAERRGHIHNALSTIGAWLKTRP